MLMTGQEYLESIRDGRRIYIGGELVEDVTTHPAFRNAAKSFAMIYDRKRAPENRDVMTFDEDGDTFSSYFLLPRTREDLQKRFETHRRIASWTYGLLGRSPDNFPSYVSGLVMDPPMFDRIRQGFGDNMVKYYKHMRGNDIFASHTVTNPQGWRLVSPADAQQRTPPTLRVVDEDDSGVTINGLKMLGTAMVFCHETWCGNLQPVAPGQVKESITCAVPLNAPGVSLWSRKPYERYAVSEFDNPLAARFDENDAAVLFENVKVPWERVFCHDNVEMTRAIYMRTPGHAMANHQANVRFLEKLKLIVGIADKVVQMNGAKNVPAVQFTLGRLAAMQATLEGLIMGQINCGEEQAPGYHTVNRRYVYAALHWCSNHHSEICDTVRELMGAGVFQMPADASVLQDE
jgi:4-hydroxyphenylacetate 3-monooxygenase